MDVINFFFKFVAEDQRGSCLAVFRGIISASTSYGFAKSDKYVCWSVYIVLARGYRGEVQNIKRENNVCTKMKLSLNPVVPHVKNSTVVDYNITTHTNKTVLL